jgi:HK97 family phage portal protein
VAWPFSRKSEVAELREQVDSLTTQARAIGGFPWIEDNPLIPFGSGGPAHPSQVRMGIDHALRLTPLYAAARLLADGVASLPIQVFRPDGSGEPMKWTGPTIFNSSSAQVGPMGAGPSPVGTLYDWVFTCMTSLVLEGNAFGYIAARDGFGFPTVIEWMSPHLVWIDEPVENGVPNPLRAEYYYAGALVPKADVFHIRAFTVPGRVRGISPMRAFVTIVSQGLNINKFGNDWFEAGGHPPGIFKNTVMEVDEDNSAEIKQRLVAAQRRHQPLVIGADWDYTPVQVPPEEAQFVQAVEMNANQIAAVYGVPAYRVGGASGAGSLRYSNVESEQISFITDTLRPWLVRLESAFYGLLPGERYCRFNADAMVKTDLKTRHEVFAIDRGMGLKNIDELRALDDLEPLKGGTGKDDIPATLAADVSRSGKAIPKIWADQMSILEVPPGATPAAPGSETAETPPPAAAGGEPGKPAATPPNGTPAAPKPGGQAGPPPVRRPAAVPAAKAAPVRSVADVAAQWAGDGGVDPLRLRGYLAEAGMAARRHGLSFRSYTEASMDEEQAGWLLGFCRAQPVPEPVKASPNGHVGAAR